MSDTEPAFPGPVQGSPHGELYEGMTLRDYYLASVMQGLLASGPHDCSYKELVFEASDVVEWMMEARKQ